VETILSDAMFEAPGSSVKFVLVTEAVADRKEQPIYAGVVKRSSIPERENRVVYWARRELRGSVRMRISAHPNRTPQLPSSPIHDPILPLGYRAALHHTGTPLKRSSIPERENRVVYWARRELRGSVRMRISKG
jgi:hypothetical protein